MNANALTQASTVFEINLERCQIAKKVSIDSWIISSKHIANWYSCYHLIVKYFGFVDSLYTRYYLSLIRRHTYLYGKWKCILMHNKFSKALCFLCLIISANTYVQRGWQWHAFECNRIKNIRLLCELPWLCFIPGLIIYFVFYTSW